MKRQTEQWIPANAHGRLWNKNNGFETGVHVCGSQNLDT